MRDVRKMLSHRYTSQVMELRRLAASGQFDSCAAALLNALADDVEAKALEFHATGSD